MTFTWQDAFAKNRTIGAIKLCAFSQSLTQFSNPIKDKEMIGLQTKKLDQFITNLVG